VQLINGRSEVEPAPGSAAKVVTQIFGNEATGDLDGDDVADTAFVLTQSSGGKGTFYYVAVARKSGDGWTGTNAILLQVDPEYQLHMPAMKSQAGLAKLRGYAAVDEQPLSQERAAAIRRLTERLALALAQADALGDRIRTAAAVRFAPLTQLCGVNALTAGMLAGILGPGRRFVSDAALAAYAGASPLEASSAGHVRHRLNRGGNRRLNAILYMIALSQARHSEQARTYLARRVSEGKTRREAMRTLKRYIVRAIWRLWMECYPTSEVLPRSRLHIGASDRVHALAALQTTGLNPPSTTPPCGLALMFTMQP
jgi:hypothetical protein